MKTCLKRIGAALLIGLLPDAALGQWVCSADVSYRWRKNGEAEQMELWSSFRRERQTKESSADALEVALSKQKIRAKEDCQRKHEDLARCISAKFSATKPLLPSLGFEARQQLEKAIASDCASMQGVCVDTVVSEIKCSESVAAEGKTGDSASKKEKDKDKEQGKAKGKDKKK